MSIFLGFAALAIAAWAIHASIRIIRRIGFRRYSVALGQLGWGLGKTGLALMAIAVAAVSKILRSSADGELYYGVGVKDPGQLRVSSYAEDDDGRVM
jgi:hypothetical protein